MIVALRAPSLAKFDEVDTVPVCENILEYNTLHEGTHITVTPFCNIPNTNTLQLFTKK